MADPFLGQIQPMGFGFAPQGWAKCDGQVTPIASLNALFALLGTMYGGDGQTTFALPDLRGRFPVHHGSGFPQGARSGQESRVLGVNEMPSHSHQMTARATGAEAGTNTPANNQLAAAEGAYSDQATDIVMGTGSIQVQNTGTGQAFDHMPPFVAINWCIALIGIFPSR
ncbi:MAG: tail fiber protein [Planctomycetota bacterium]